MFDVERTLQFVGQKFIDAPIVAFLLLFPSVPSVTPLCCSLPLPCPLDDTVRLVVTPPHSLSLFQLGVNLGALKNNFSNSTCTPARSTVYGLQTQTLTSPARTRSSTLG